MWHHRWARLALFALFAAGCYMMASLYTGERAARDERDDLTGHIELLEDRTETQSRRIDELTVLLAAQQERSECIDVLEGALEVALVARFEAVLDGDPESVAFTEAVVTEASERYLRALNMEFCPPPP